jgi:hypothetical protein
LARLRFVSGLNFGSNHAEFKQQGRMVTQLEAEEFKISRHQDWYEKPYVREWTGLIAEHIREYVRTIQYDIWLPDNPSLEVVITGGSSAVKPMREELLNRVRTALSQRGLSKEFSDRTHLIEPKSDFQLNRAYRDIELAQLAVCLGASDPLLTELKSYPQGIS